MIYQGSCHCGKIAFEVDGEPEQVMDCNCSICSRLGYLHWFVPRDKRRLLTPEQDLATYTLGKQAIKHHYCPNSRIHRFSEGIDASGYRTAAVIASCLEGVDLQSLLVTHFDGPSRQPGECKSYLVISNHWSPIVIQQWSDE